MMFDSGLYVAIFLGGKQMPIRKSWLLAASAAALLVANSASAQTVDFDSQPAPLGFNGSSFNDSGFTFTASPEGFSYVWTGDSPNSNGTNNLILGFSPTGAITVTKMGGGSFTLKSFDMAISWYSGNTVDQISLNGNPLNISNVLTTYNVNLTGSSVTLTGLASNSGYWTADNFVFGKSAAPEPASWAMMIVGFGAVGAGMRMRRSATLSAA